MPHLMLKDLPRYECLLEAARKFPDLDPTASEALLHLLRAGDDVFRVTEHNFAAHHISQGRFTVMMLAFKETDCAGPGPHTPASLADAAGVTRATMTGLIDTLERDGYVTRTPDLNDRRQMTVAVTPKGAQFLEAFLPRHFRSIAQVMSVLDDSERRTLVQLCTKISASASALTQRRDEAPVEAPSASPASSAPPPASLPPSA